MKKILLIMMLLLSFVSVAFAKTPPGFYNMKDGSRFGLGGLRPLMTYEQVEKIYGSATEAYRSKKAIDNGLYEAPYYKWEIHYGKTVKLELVQLANSNRLTLLLIESTGNNGWKTPDGLTVGMKEEMIEKTLGKAYRVEHKKNQYFYNWESWSMVFTVQNGVITKIVCVAREE